MKQIRMIISAIVVLGAVGSIFSFKTKIRPTLYTCEGDTCILTPNKNDERRGVRIENPGYLFKNISGLNCGSENPTCIPYFGDVYQAN